MLRHNQKKVCLKFGGAQRVSKSPQKASLKEHLAGAGKMGLMRFHLSELQVLQQRYSPDSCTALPPPLCGGRWHSSPWTSFEGFGPIRDATEPSQGLNRKRQFWGSGSRHKGPSGSAQVLESLISHSF